MPFESSTPLIVISLVAVVAAGWHGLSTGSRGGLTAAACAGLAAVACFIADWTVVTDREHLETLFPRLAAAAVRQDIDTLLAAVAPELRPLRTEVTEVMRQVKPSEIEVARTSIEIAPNGTRASVDLVVRITGNVIDRGTPSTAIAGVLMTLEKRGDRWFVIDAEERPIRPGGP